MKSMSLNCRVLVKVSPGFVSLVPSVYSMVGQAGSPRIVLASLADLSCGFALFVMQGSCRADVEHRTGERTAGILTVFPCSTSRDA